MNKLEELLKEQYWYNDVRYTKQSDYWYMFWLNDFAVREERIISKRFGFIKRLVDNDKIDRNKIYWLDIWYKIEEIWIWKRKNTVNLDLLNKLLMLLSIQDEPIEFLISILK